MKRYLFYTLLIFSLFSMTAQETAAQDDTDSGAGDAELAPDEMELVVPTILLEVEEEKLALIEAPLPGDEERTLSALVLPLPEAPELEISPFEVEIPAFLDLSSLVMGVEVEDDSEDTVEKTFYSTGLIGGGTGSRILGDITLYKLGYYPRFQLHFFHEGIAGFGEHQAGEGYSMSMEKLSGSLELGNDQLFSETEIQYNENALGLQGQSTYSSVTLRDYSLDTDFAMALNETMGLRADFFIGAQDQWLDGTDPPQFSGLSVRPEVSYYYNTSWAALETSIAYDMEGAERQDDDSTLIHAFTGLVEGRGELPFGIDWEAAGGVLWQPGELPVYPLALKLTGEPLTNLFIHADLRKVAEQPSLQELWNDSVYLKPETAAGDALDLTPLTGWYGLLHSRYLPFSFLTVNAEIEYEYYDNGFYPSAVDAEGLSSLTRDEVNALFTGISLEVGLPRSFGLTAGWVGNLFLKDHPLRPEHLFRMELNWLPDETYGAELTGELAIYEEDNSVYTTQWVPEIGFSGYVTIIEGIRIIIEGEDLFAPLLDSGRLVWDNYEDTGFAVTVKLGISL